MRVEIKFDPFDAVEPAAADLLAAEIRSSDQFDAETDTLVLTERPVL